MVRHRIPYAAINADGDQVTIIPSPPLSELLELGEFYTDPLTGTTAGDGCMGNQRTGVALCGATGGRRPTRAQRRELLEACPGCVSEVRGSGRLPTLAGSLNYTASR